ncbi:MAG: hypothetical protein HDR12_00755 [Lachnospiraceae bacterium]|nr:hypothetical protein [Lachnospiraceae bacterium]
MNTRVMHILTGALFALAGILTLIEGVCNMRASNIFIGISFVVVGALYFIRKKKMSVDKKSNQW